VAKGVRSHRAGGGGGAGAEAGAGERSGRARRGGAGEGACDVEQRIVAAPTAVGGGDGGQLTVETYYGSCAC